MTFLCPVVADSNRYDGHINLQDQRDGRLVDIRKRLDQINARLRELDAIPDEVWQGKPELQEEYNLLIAEQGHLYAEVNGIETNHDLPPDNNVH